MAVASGTVAAQDPAPGKPFAPGDVVAVIEGQEYTAEQIEWIRKNTPPEFVKQTAQMTYAGFLEALAMQIAVANRAEEMKLADKEPYRTRLEINKRIFLTNAYLAEIQQVLQLEQEDYREYYDKHKGDYEEVRVSAIYINYSLDPAKAAPKDGKAPLGEQEAWAKAEQLLAEMRQGADFAELARKYSDDPATAEKGGDLGYFKRDSRIPDPLKSVIFALEEGGLSAPVKYAGRYYILKATEKRALSYTDALPHILQKIQDVKIKEKLEEIRTQTRLEIKNEAFAASRPGPGADSAPARPPAPVQAQPGP
jgi:parvulin-like peptidyl-prolyl isomerase